MQEEVLDNSYLERNVPKHAKSWKRFLALLFDGFFFVICSVVISYFRQFNNVPIVTALVLLIYKPSMEHIFGATLGKMVFKLNVTSVDFQKPSLLQILLRHIFMILSQIPKMLFLMLSFDLFQVLDLDFLPRRLARNDLFFLLLFLIDAVVYIFNSNHQALHDLIAKTIVIEKRYKRY